MIEIPFNFANFIIQSAISFYILFFRHLDAVYTSYSCTDTNVFLLLWTTKEWEEWNKNGLFFFFRNEPFERTEKMVKHNKTKLYIYI